MKILIIDAASRRAVTGFRERRYRYLVAKLGF
jgi:hypothetical protein